MLSCEIGQSKKIWKTRSDEKRKIEIWIDGLEKMRALEEYYEVVFDLEWIQGWESIRELYEAIDIVYNGIAIIYTSFKYGNFEGERSGRFFCDFTEKVSANL